MLVLLYCTVMSWICTRSLIYECLTTVLIVALEADDAQKPGGYRKMSYFMSHWCLVHWGKYMEI